MAEFVHASTYGDLPSTVTNITWQHLLDTLGCCLAATKVDTSRLLRSYVLSEGEAEQATAIGIPRRLPAAQAALINGLLARTLEFDDMAMPDLHPSGVVVPVCPRCGRTSWDFGNGPACRHHTWSGVVPADRMGGI
jgi:2-methylcitrate dehydratase PrpD